VSDIRFCLVVQASRLPVAADAPRRSITFGLYRRFRYTRCNLRKAAILQR